MENNNGLTDKQVAGLTTPADREEVIEELKAAYHQVYTALQWKDTEILGVTQDKDAFKARAHKAEAALHRIITACKPIKDNSNVAYILKLAEEGLK